MVDYTRMTEHIYCSMCPIRYCEAICCFPTLKCKILHSISLLAFYGAINPIDD